MSNDLAISIQMGALPPAVKWTPQQLADAIAARLRLVTSGTYVLIAGGSTEPASDVGPWFDGQSFFYYSYVTGNYQPIVLSPESLGYWIGPDAPDPTIYNFWIETAVGGSPLALKIYYSGGWVDVYAALIAGYMTVAAFNAAIANYSTTVQMTAAIAAALVPYSDTTAMNAAITAAIAPKAPLASPTFTGTPAAPTAAPGTNTTQLATTAFVGAAISAIPAPSAFAAYPAQGVVNGQTVPIDGAATFDKLEFNNATINPAPAPFNTTTFRYIAPADGSYSVSFSCQCDDAGGVPAMMSVQAALYKNGTFIGNLMADIDNTPSPNGDRWSPGFSGLVELVATDYLEVFMSAEDGTNAGDLTVSAQISVHRVSALS